MAIIVKPEQKNLTYSYIPLSERGDDNPFTVKIKRLSPRHFTILEDKMAKINQDESISFTTGTFNWAVLGKGLIGWENLVDPDNKTINPSLKSDGTVSDDSLDLLPLTLLAEIANTIVNISRDPDHTDLYLGVYEPAKEVEEQEKETKKSTKGK